MSRSLAIEAACAIVSLLDQAYGDNAIAKRDALNVVQSLLNIAPDPPLESQRQIDPEPGGTQTLQ